MKTATVASAFLVAAAAAQPHGHGHRKHHNAGRQAVVTTTQWMVETEFVTEIIDATTTLWLLGGQSAEAVPTIPAEPSDGQFFEPRSSSLVKPTGHTAAATPAHKPEPTKSVNTPPPPPSSKPSVASPSPSPQPSVASPSPSPQPSVASPKPQPTTSANVPPPPASTPSPSPISSPGPAPSVPAQPPNGGSSHSGDITYYNIGMGSCGIDDTGNDQSVSIVALAVGFIDGSYTGNPNKNPLCGKTITIHAGGKSTTAMVKDTCMGCKPTDIDVSEKVFLELFGSLDGGREPATWFFN